MKKAGLIRWIIIYLAFFMSHAAQAQDPEPLIPNFKPEIGIGKGVLTYYGDVENTFNANPFVNNIGTSFNISRDINDYAWFNFFVIYGTLSGNEDRPVRNLNFKTSIINGGISVSYNFSNLYDNPLPIDPYISLGIGLFEYNSKTDLKKGDTLNYFYWDDGTIRDMPQTDQNTLEAQIISRDYIYETDLREEYVDDLGRYTQFGLGIPFDIGFTFQVNPYVSMRFGNQYTFTFTDKIDNVTPESSGDRKGQEGNDKFMYTYVSLQVDLYADPGQGGESLFGDETDFSDVDLSKIEDEDEDKDGVNDIMDECPKTPNGVNVDAKGCPVDSDGDGIADFRDKEKNTPEGRAVDKFGRSLSDANYPKLLLDTTSMKASDMSVEEAGGKQEIPDKFKKVDLDKDGNISFEELGKVIDAVRDEESDYTQEDLDELQEFFFNQSTD